MDKKPLRHSLVVYYKPMSEEHENWMFDHIESVVFEINYRDYYLKAGRMLSGDRNRPSITFTPTELKAITGCEFKLEDVNTLFSAKLYKFKYNAPRPEGFKLEIVGARWDGASMQFCKDEKREDWTYDDGEHVITIRYRTSDTYKEEFQKSVQGVVLRQSGVNYALMGTIEHVPTKIHAVFNMVVKDVYVEDEKVDKYVLLGKLATNAATGKVTSIYGLIMKNGDIPREIMFAELDGIRIKTCDYHMEKEDIEKAKQFSKFSDDPKVEETCQKAANDAVKTILDNGETKALCPVCMGSGKTNWYVGNEVRTEDCKICAGSGFVNTEQFNAYVAKYVKEGVNKNMGKSKIRFVRTCYYCSGTGKTMTTTGGYEVEGKCMHCDGTGKLVGYPAITVKTGSCGGEPIEDPAATPDIQIDKEYIKNLVQQFVQQFLAEKNLGHVEADNWRVNGHDTGIPLESMDARVKMFEERYALKGQTPLPLNIQSEKHTPIRDFMTGKTQSKQANPTHVDIHVEGYKHHFQVRQINDNATQLVKGKWTVKGGCYAVAKGSEPVPDNAWHICSDLFVENGAAVADVEIMRGGTVTVRSGARISNVRIYPGGKLILEKDAMAFFVYNYGGVVSGVSQAAECNLMATASTSLYCEGNEITLHNNAVHHDLTVVRGGKAISLTGSVTFDTRIRTGGIFIAEEGSVHYNLKVCPGGILVARPGCKLINLRGERGAVIYLLDGATLICPRFNCTVLTLQGMVDELDNSPYIVDWLPNDESGEPGFEQKPYNKKELDDVSHHTVLL